jgi:fibronectin-binding autotransporter adhesin
MKPKSTLFKRVSTHTFVPSMVLVGFAASTANCSAADDFWTGTISADWNEGGNWSLGVVPQKATDNNAAVINLSSGAIATISSNIVAPTDIQIGSGAASSGRLDHTAGSAATGGGNWMKVGHNGGTGVYNLADTASAGGTLTGFGEGTGSLTVNGQFRLGGGDAGSGGKGTANIHTSGTLAVTDQFHVGTNASTGILNLDKGTVTAGSTVYIGNGASGGSGVIGTFNMSGGTFTKSGGNNFLVGDAGATGNLEVTGGTLTNNGEFQIGNGSGSHGNVTLSGSGTINTGSWVSIGRSTGTGVMNVFGGTLTKTNANTAFIVGDGSTGTLNQTGGAITASGEFWVASGTSTGTYNMSGGTLNTSNWFVVGRNANGVGLLKMTGGTINNTGTGSDLVVGANQGSSGTILLSGGTLNATGRNTSIGKGSGTGVVTLSGVGELKTNQLMLGESGGTGTVNFNGGSLRVVSINGLTGNSTFNFNGGTLQATADSVNFISGLTTAQLQDGGALIDTQSFHLTAAQAFTGSGGLTKSGAGSLTLTGVSSYTGTTTVSEGKLIVEGNISTSGFTNVALGAAIGGSGTIGNLTIEAGGTFAPGSSIGTLHVVGALSLGGQSVFEISPGGLADRAIALAQLAFGGTLEVVNIGDALVGGETFDLFDWGSSTGTFTSVSLPSLDSGLSWDDRNLYVTGQITVIPEPTTALLGWIGLGGIWRRRRP